MHYMYKYCKYVQAYVIPKCSFVVISFNLAMTNKLLVQGIKGIISKLRELLV